MYTESIEAYSNYYFWSNCTWTLCTMWRTNIVREVKKWDEEYIVRAYPNSKQNDKFNREVNTIQQLEDMWSCVPEIVNIDVSCGKFPTPLYIYKKIPGEILHLSYDEVNNPQLVFDQIHKFLVNCSKVTWLFVETDPIDYIWSHNNIKSIEELLVKYKILPEDDTVKSLIKEMDKKYEAVYIDLNPRNIIIHNGEVRWFIDFDYWFKWNLLMSYGNLLSTNFVRNAVFLESFLHRMKENYTITERNMIHIFAIWRCLLKISRIDKNNREEQKDYEERIIFNKSKIQIM